MYETGEVKIRTVPSQRDMYEVPLSMASLLMGIGIWLSPSPLPQETTGNERVQVLWHGELAGCAHAAVTLSDNGV